MNTTNLTNFATDPAEREFPAFDLVRLLGTVFEPTQGCRVCLLIDADDPAAEMQGFAFLKMPGREIHQMASRSRITARTNPRRMPPKFFSRTIFEEPKVSFMETKLK